MVCFIIKLQVNIPSHGERGTIQRLTEHVFFHSNADFSKTAETITCFFYSIRVCDEDTLTVLRDLPQPFHVESIHYLQSGDPLYMYRRHKQPPFNPLLQDIYWLAKSTEKWKFLT